MPPLTIVIFGASGDLTARKLIPSLYQLHRKGRLADEVRIVGVARSPFSDDAFREKLAAALREFEAKSWQTEAWDRFAKRLFYVACDAVKPGGLEPLQKWLADTEGQGDGNRLYYLSVSPALYADLITRLGESGVSKATASLARRM